MSAENTETVVRVDLAEGGYDIVIGSGLLPRIGDLLRHLMPDSKVCVVTDENVGRLYLLGVMKALEVGRLPRTPAIIVPPGEGSKSFPRLASVIDEALEYNLDRGGAFVALGGGVVGDLAGFAAAVYMRGVPVVQVPTTLLAQVDSSVGGKTGVNTARGKNVAGVFHQPSLVLVDVDTLKTLPPREMLAGYAEILKVALAGRPDMFEWLEKEGGGIIGGDAAVQARAIELACEYKAETVRADPHDKTGLRALLNLGHTFGHALEAIGGYDGRLLHGEAVALGLRWAAGFSVEMGQMPPEDAARLDRHLDAMGMMRRPPFPCAPDEMLAHMRRDKKTAGGRIRLVLLRGIGKAYVEENVDDAKLHDFLTRMCAGQNA